MQVRCIARRLFVLVVVSLPVSCRALSPLEPPRCRRATIEGELHAGEPFSRPIGNGLKVFVQPIHSGWILRVLPVSGAGGEHDYAELATPPYQSVTPLSISTDFSFRAQDAVGWNPRRFRFATSAESFRQLEGIYRKLPPVGTEASPVQEAELARQIAHAAEGNMTILDARLVPGSADQGPMAAAVASHFSDTAHTLVQERDGGTNALGRIVWLRFRLELKLPANFRVEPALQTVSVDCGAF